MLHEQSASTVSTVAGAITGTAGLTFPLWHDVVVWATGLNQFLISLLGLVILILTARKLWLDNKLASKKLRDGDKGK